MISRRAALTGGGGLLALGVAGAGGAYRDGRARADELSFGVTVATTVGEGGWRASRRGVEETDRGLLVEGRRTLDGRGAEAAVAAQDELLAGIPYALLDPTGEHRELLTGAALDLWVLSWRLPVAVAGWEGRWRYAWPRDTAHVAVAFAELGDVGTAVRQLAALARLVGEDRVEARYLPEGGVPDGRHPQDDGIGWVLWACGRLHGTWVGGPYRDVVADLVRRCARMGLDRLGADGLPRVSPDYWEVATSRLTLGTVAPILAGLEAAVPVLARLGGEGDVGLARRCARAAERLEERAAAVFGAAGWPRERGRTQRDTAIAFMLPPYRSAGDAEGSLRAALDGAAGRMRRANGGYAPGVGWRVDGVAWTPETAVLAGAWAGDPATRERAQETLRWLDEHRTVAGSLPEKVLADGSPAGPAPLAWTAASVVLALRALSEGV
ncbi:hypothetical protein GCM10022199_10740 [Marihabitans asiaticum]|uniref:GH15 family glucan-1,4-alpha-glucosidase n=1 Tax=Marihabitans asiaticum TaxID=415218 RepID=A0A560WHD1_9MICO|nr:hypothetical protein [Marihabitans asiaticum]TWD17091.1 hypothetical protein FB557_0649 [Marihabitans asiaticum]